LGIKNKRILGWFEVCLLSREIRDIAVENTFTPSFRQWSLFLIFHAG
jgi:hypothetical protein